MSGILHAVVAAKERPTPDEILRDARGGQPEKLAALRAYLSDGICWYLRRSFGQHDVDRELVYVLDTIAAIVLQGHVGSGDELTSLTRIAVLTTVEQAIASGDRMMPIVQSNKRNVELMKQALIEFSETEREALSMHCEGWPIDRICALTGQTEAKFAEFRSRLKTRYAQLSCYESTPVLSRIVISSRSKPN